MSQTTLKDRYDVVVVGGGPAGVGAAVAAARAGASTLLVERLGYAGGGMSVGLALTPVGFEPFTQWAMDTDPDGWKVLGIPRELFERVHGLGAVVKPVWDPEVTKWVLDRMLGEAGVQMLYWTTCLDVLRDGERVTGVVLAARQGLLEVEAGLVVDCSGDGDVLARAEAAHDFGRAEDGLPAPMALSCFIGGVDLPYTPELPYLQMMLMSWELISAHLQQAVNAGDVPPVMCGFWYPRVVPGRVLLDQLWTRLVPMWGDPTRSEVLSDGEVRCRDIVYVVHEWLRDNVAGFKDSYVSQLSGQLWPRESRRLRGLATLDEADVAESRKRDDGIAKGTCFIELRSPVPGDLKAEAGFEWDQPRSLYGQDIEYDIPYGSLVPEAVDGLLVAGRCMSVSHVAQGSTRMQITSMACGQAAGTAAAACVEQGREPRDLDVSWLRDRLRKAGAVV